MPKKKRFFTVAEVDASDDYNPPFTARYLRRLIFERRIPVHRIGGKVLLATADLDALLARGREEVPHAS